MPEQINPLNVRLAHDYAKNLPWNCFKPEELGPCLMNFMKDQDIYYKRWAQKWFENYQFLFGNGDLRWSPKYDYAVDADFLLQRIPTTVQKSYTNIARVVEEALTSFVYGNQPEWSCEATDDSKKTAKRVSRIVQSLLDGYFEKLCLNDDYQVGAFIFSLYGQGVFWNEWNPIAGQAMDIPQYQKQKVPVFSDWAQPSPFGGMIESPIAATGLAGEPLTEERWMPVLDAMGRQIVKKMFTGDISNKVLTPLEYRRDIGSQGMHKTRYVQRIALYDYDEWLDIFGATAGKTPYFDGIRPIFSSNEVFNFAMSHFLRMQMVTPPILNERMGKSNSLFRSSMFRYKVLVLEHFDRPHPIKWPMGRRIIVSNGVCTHITVPQYNTNKLDGWHPAAEAQWMKIAPSSIGLGPMNDVIIKNRELNVKDSLGSTALRRNMASHLLIKQNQGVDSALFTGEPGGIFEVPDPNGFRYLHDELPLPAIYNQFRENDKVDAYESSGAGEALRGEAPSNVTSGYQEKIRIEREEKRLIVAKRAFENAVSTNGEKLFWNLKTNVVQLDESTIGFLKRSAAGKFTIPDVIGVLTAPTDYGIDIRVKSNSMSVRSEATELATIQELSQQPALAQRLQQDARTLDNYLKKFGIEDLRDASAVHRDRAQRENEVFEDMLRLGANPEGVSWPIVAFEDDDLIHMQEHDDWLLENFDEVSKNPEFMQKFLLHKNFHTVQYQEKTGGALPGTAQATPTAQAAVAGAQPPAPEQLIGYNQMKIAQEQKAAALPKEAGQPGAKPKDPNAPSNLTAPTSNTSGGGR